MDKIIEIPISQIKKMIKQRFRSRHIKTRPLVIVGHTGVGKTQAVRQCATELSEEIGQNVECRITSLQFMEAPDLCGLPYIEQEKEYKVSRHARPKIVPDSGYGIWFLDEVNRCNRDMRQALITLIEDREVNGHKVSENWIFVMACNPLEADGVSYEVQEFDAALENRITKVAFKPSIQEFTDFLVERYKIENPVVRWVMNQPDIVDFRGKLRTSPRGLEYLIRAIQADNDEIQFETVAAEIGVEAAHTFRKFLSSPDYIKPEDIVNNYNKDMSERLAKLEEQGRTDILNSLIQGVCNTVATIGIDKLNKKQLRNIAKYQEEADADSKSAFWLSLGERIPDNEGFNKIADAILGESPDTVKFLKRVQSSKEQ